MNTKAFKFIFLLFIALLPLSNNAQEKEKKETPIIYGDLSFGGGREIKGNGGFIFGGGLYYQFNSNLISLRYVEHSQLKSKAVFITPFTPIPIVFETNNHKESSVLYGKRWINKGTSYSISGGISYNRYFSNLKDENDNTYKLKDNFAGFPFELNIRWFKSKKKRYRIYTIFPVGKPTAFGRNIGFKIVGNISKKSFVGLALTYGFGYHKNYETIEK